MRISLTELKQIIRNEVKRERARRLNENPSEPSKSSKINLITNSIKNIWTSVDTNIPKNRHSVSEGIKNKVKELFQNLFGEEIAYKINILPDDKLNATSTSQKSYDITYNFVPFIQVKVPNRNEDPIEVEFVDIQNNFKTEILIALSQSKIDLVEKVCEKVSPFLLINLPKTGEVLVNNIKKLALKNMSSISNFVTIDPILPTSPNETINVSFDYKNKYFDFFKMFLENFDDYKVKIQIKLVGNETTVTIVGNETTVN